MYQEEPAVPQARFAVRCYALIVTAALLSVSAVQAEAALITIDPAGMNAIFSQPSFGDTPVAIEFLPPENDRRS